jgi:CheY-like chemotaxis protein
MDLTEERTKRIAENANPGALLSKRKTGTILVVEDSLDDFRLLELGLKRADVAAEFRHVLDGSEALRYLMGEGDYGNRVQYPLPQMILSDLKMPRMDGIELLRWVRSNSRTKRIPFIMLSSSNQPNDVARAYENHVNSYLFKPGGLVELSEMLRILVGYWLVLNLLPELHEHGK